MYAIKEMFYSLQGEGVHAGRPSVFMRFAGCNLWTGREKDRAHAICKFCDTDFIGTQGLGGGRFQCPEELARTAFSFWPKNVDDNAPHDIQKKWIICTGGEPLLQLDPPLIKALHNIGFMIAIETNGTLPAPTGIDWICVSPKANAPLKQISGHELKFVYPQTESRPEDFAHLNFSHFSLQPLDTTPLGILFDKNPHQNNNIQACLTYVLAHPQWRLSLQTHKYLEVR